MRRIVLVFLFCLLAGCTDKQSEVVTPTATATPPSDLTSIERDFQLERDKDGKIQTEAREAAIDAMKRNYPKVEIVGTSTQGFQGNTFWVDLDIKDNGKPSVVSVNVQRFFDANGKGYWRVSTLNDTHKARLSTSDPLIKEKDKWAFIDEGNK